MSPNDTEEDLGDYIAEIFEGDEDAADYNIFGPFLMLAEQNNWSCSHCPAEASLTLVIATQTGGVCQVLVLYNAEKSLLSLVIVHELSDVPSDLVRFYACLNSESISAQKSLGGGFTYIAHLGIIVLRVGQSFFGTPGVSVELASELLQKSVQVMQQAQLKFMTVETSAGKIVTADMERLMNSRAAGSA